MKTPLKISDIMRYLEAKGAKFECIACGHTRFNYIDESQNQVHLALLGFKFPEYDLNTTDMFGVVLISCSNCGLVRLHIRAAIADWAANNPPH